MKKGILITLMFVAMLWAQQVEPFTGVCGPLPWWLRDTDISDHRFRGICAINNSLVWVVGEDGEVYKRIGEAHSHDWIPITIDVIDQQEYHFNDVFFADVNDGWIVGERNSGENKYEGVVVWTTDGGDNWYSPTFVPSFAHPTPFLKIKTVWSAGIQHYVCYITCGNGTVLYSDDDGYTWDRRPTPWFDPLNPDNPDTISVWYNGLWLDPSDPNHVRVSGDAFGLLCESEDGGESWSFDQPSAFEMDYEFVDPPVMPHDTRLANFDMEFINSNEGFVALSYGRIGETTDGGQNWTVNFYQPQSTWFRDVTRGRSDTCFSVGNCGVVHRFDGDNFQECVDNPISVWGSNLYCADGRDSDISYAAGAAWWGTTIRQRYDLADFWLIRPRIVWIEEEPPRYEITISWGSDNQDNLKKWYVDERTLNYLGRDELQSTPIVEVEPYQHSILVTLYNDEWHYNPLTNYYFCIYAAGEEYPDNSDAFQLCGVVRIDSSQLRELEDDFGPIWEPAQNVQAYDRPYDNGDTIIVTFDGSPSNPQNVWYKIGRSRSEEGPYHYIGNADPGTPFTFVDAEAQNGIIYYYVVVIWDIIGNTYRSDYTEPVSAVAEDNLAPGEVTGLYGEFEAGTQTIALEWDAPDETYDVAGYWMCPIPPDYPDYYLTHASPISRTFYRFPIEDQYLGQNLEYYVAAMDYSGNIGSWGDPYLVYVGLNLGASNTSFATGLNNSRKMFYDSESKIMAVFTHNDSIFYRSSTDEGVSCSEKQNLTSGIYPGMILDGGELYLACVNRNPADEPYDPTEGKDYYSPGEYDWKLLFKKTDTGDWEAQTSALDSVHQDNDGGSVEFSAPCIAITDDDTVHVAFAKTMYTQVGSNWYWKWKLYYGNFHKTNPQVREWTVIDSAVEQSSRHPPEECPFNQSDPAMVADHTGSVHLAYGLYSAIKYRYRLGNIWSGIQTISGLGTHAQQSIGINGNELTVVWSGNPWPESETQILCRRRFITSGWGNVERIDTGDNASIYPVTLKNHTLWCEEVSAGNYDIYYSHLSGYSWSTPANLTNSSDRAMLPQMAYNGSDYKFYYIYTARDTLPYWVLFDEYQFEETPKYGFNLGADEPSHATVDRDGFVNYGSNAYESTDLDDSTLTYRVTGLDPNREYDLLWDWYHEMNSSMHIRIRVDNNFEFAYLVPHDQRITQRYPIPPICYADSEITVRLQKIGQGTAVLSGFAIYEKLNQGGGPQSSADGLITGKLILQIQNPTASRVKMVYQLPTACEARIKIYDITGSLVRSINLPKRQGRNEIIWDSRDNIGRKVATGIYFCRLETEQKDITQKIILLK